MYKCSQLSLHFHSCATSSLKHLNYRTSVQFSPPLVGRVLDNCVLERDVNVTFKTDLESAANCVMNKYDSSLTSKKYRELAVFE